MVWLLAVGTASAQSNRVLDLSGLYRTDIRAIAMGNSYVAVARGEGALLYNPAGLAQPDADIKLEASLDAAGSGTEFLNDTQDLVSNGLTTAGMIEYLTTYAGTTQEYTIQTFSHVLAGMGSVGFGAGYGSMDVTRLAFDFDDTGTPGDVTDDVLDVEDRQLVIQFGSAAIKFLDGQIMLGVTGKSFFYKEKTERYNFAALVLTGDLDASSTVIVDETYNSSAVDFGFLYRLESLSFLRAQWGLTVVNAGGVTLKGTNIDLDIPMTFNFGMAFSPPLPIGELLFHFEIEDTGNAITVRDNSGTDHTRSVTQRTHYGMELGLFETSFGNHIFNARVGVSRGQPTFGFELNIFSGLRIAVARYKEDSGHSDETNISDLISQAHIGLGFAF